jgi:predicted transcriptional regulator
VHHIARIGGLVLAVHELITEIVASFVGNNPVAIGDLPAVIAREAS